MNIVIYGISLLFYCIIVSTLIIGLVVGYKHSEDSDMFLITYLIFGMFVTLFVTAGFDSFISTMVK